MRTWLSVVLVMVALCSCATYVEPTSGDTATLLRTPGVGSLVMLFDNEKCDNPQFTPTSESTPVKVPAGKPLHLTRFKDTRGLSTSVYCRNFVTFTPEPGATYEVGWQLEFSYPVTCRTPITRILESGSRQPEPTAQPFAAPTCPH